MGEQSNRLLSLGKRAFLAEQRLLKSRATRRYSIDLLLKKCVFYHKMHPIISTCYNHNMP